MASMCTLVICVNTCVSLQATLSPPYGCGKSCPRAQVSCLRSRSPTATGGGLEPMAPGLSGILPVGLMLMEIRAQTVCIHNFIKLCILMRLEP